MIWKENESHSVMSDSLGAHGLYNLWNSLGQNTGVGSRSLLQRIFPTQGSNPGLLHYRSPSLQLSHRGSPSKPSVVHFQSMNPSKSFWKLSLCSWWLALRKTTWCSPYLLLKRRIFPFFTLIPALHSRVGGANNQTEVRTHEAAFYGV